LTVPVKDKENWKDGGKAGPAVKSKTARMFVKKKVKIKTHNSSFSPSITVRKF
jgi:hypothetical protein